MTHALFQLGIFSAPLEAAQKEDRFSPRTVSRCAGTLMPRIRGSERLAIFYL